MALGWGGVGGRSPPTTQLRFYHNCGALQVYVAPLGALCVCGGEHGRPVCVVGGLRLPTPPLRRQNGGAVQYCLYSALRAIPERAAWYETLQ